jgi:hypothetical protein
MIHLAHEAFGGTVGDISFGKESSHFLGPKLVFIGRETKQETSGVD